MAVPDSACKPLSGSRDGNTLPDQESMATDFTAAEPTLSCNQGEFRPRCSVETSGNLRPRPFSSARDPSHGDVIYQIEVVYGFTPLMISVGTAYFRRLAASNAIMMAVALGSSSFNSFVAAVPAEEPGRCKPLVGAIHANFLNDDSWLTLIHLTCTLLAAKNLEDVPHKNLLQTMMGHLYCAEPDGIHTNLVNELELEVLQVLDWRLELTSTERHSMAATLDRELGEHVEDHMWPPPTDLTGACHLNMSAPLQPHSPLTAS